MLIMGDINYPVIDYLQNSVSAGHDSAAAKFLDTTQDLLLFQHVTEPTRMRQGQQPSTLDYVFTDSDNVIEEIKYTDPLGKSDHVTMMWDLLIETTKPASNQPKFNYCKGDYDSITAKLLLVDWKATFQNTTANQRWLIFKRVLATLTEEYIPLKEEFRKRKGQWISKATIKLMKQRGTAWRKYRQFQSAANYDEYRKIRNKVNEMVKADGDAHRKRLLKGFKGNPKRFYGYMRGLQSVKDNVTGLKKADGAVTDTDEEAANELANCFQHMFTKDDGVEAELLADVAAVLFLARRILAFYRFLLSLLTLIFCSVDHLPLETAEHFLLMSFYIVFCGFNTFVPSLF